MLYTYRNTLVHDFRALGPGYNLPEDQAPYYIITRTSSASNNASEFHWELVYPIEVLRSGRFWLKALNRRGM